MSNKKKKKKIKKNFKKTSFIILPDAIKQKIFGVVMILVAVIVGLSFFDKAGMAGRIFMRASTGLVGKVVFAFPFFLVLGGLIFWEGLRMFRKKWWLAILAIFIFILGISGILGCFNQTSRLGGWIGYIMSWPLLKLFGFWVTLIVFSGLSAVASLIIFYPLWQQKKESERVLEKEAQTSFIKREIFPRFKVKEISYQKPQLLSEKPEKPEKTESIPELELRRTPLSKTEKKYERPPIDLLERDKKGPQAGDLRTNGLIIKRTLQNFNIPVEMGQVNIGPTVTQYTLKPAEGIKLSKITTLSNDLALALASHPIRIEAPIPGKSLVGIEVPNPVRARVRLKDLIQNPNFQNSISALGFVLGRDVAGNPVYADLAEMPHLLVAGSTGSGKTVLLNSLILSLLYRNSPEILKLILVDPKRVEFPVYNGLPHLLGPVICNNGKTVKVLKWLIEEMEGRFDILSQFKSKDLASYNERALNNESMATLPYIVFIIDELADLMASKGREVEAGIVRLAQMARAVGIHLVVATQRPSVEVITGLIKANITSRIAFQVASQIDSRTVFDMAGAEKLLGRGDMLFTSSEISKPKRIQGALITEKEVKGVANFIKSKFVSTEIGEEKLAESLRRSLEEESSEGFDVFSRGEDPLYETAKRVIIEAGRASASLLQRRLQIGYARAARLLDMLEERGVVGAADGAKPRAVYEEKSSEDNFQEEEVGT